MAIMNDNGRNTIIEKIVEYIHKKLPPEEAAFVAEFTRQFYPNASYQDLREREIPNLYGAIISHWELIKKRKPGETHIRIYNPHYEQYGWQSTHTIVEISHDDMPFLVDSLRIELNRQELTTHFIIHFGGMKLRRNEEGVVTEILPFNTPVTDGINPEAPIYIEVDRRTHPEVLETLKANLQRVLQDVRNAVEDWPKMRIKVREALAQIDKTKLPLDPDDVNEAKDFLRWLENDHFTFLGYRFYEVIGEGEKRALKLLPNSGLGVLRDTSQTKSYRSFADLTPEARKAALSKHILLISKTNTKSTVHRPVYTDYIGLKIFTEEGKLVGEHRFIGLYTSIVYNSNPKYIPFVRRKVALIVKNSNLSPTGHAGKALLNILETFPRDDLFQATAEELAQLTMGILHLQERKKIRLFARKDIYGRFISCLVYVPRERFTTRLAIAMEKVLLEEFHGKEISYNTRFSDSVLARIHFSIRTKAEVPVAYDLDAIEKKLIELARLWIDELKDNLLEYFGEEKGNNLFHKYLQAFPAGYREAFTARNAIYDIEHIESLSDELPLTMAFYRPLEEAGDLLRFKLFRPDDSIPLSDALPIFENMGLRVLGERPYEITFQNNKKAWINDFTVVASKNTEIDIESIKTIFQDTFFHVWLGDAEDDSFNRLVLLAQLSWREVTILRAYCKYLRQTGFTYSQLYIEETAAKYPVLAQMLVQLFLHRFEPGHPINEEKVNALEISIKKELDSILLLDEDRIMRRFFEAIMGTLRTNYFQVENDNSFKKYLSLKLSPADIPDLPQPLPMFEIYVYSPRFEGVHLRSSKVARGGLRWSDRREDFRTEILGLMKAQNVKNAVIVPSGAKGGFVPKMLPIDGSREQIMEEVISCYKTFIRGLLDLTDNIVNNVLVYPNNVVRYDDDDPYLVVAADKGTATFSDIANGIARDYNFWLDDAFASGGSTGYDHKKMGITARGAWESVKRHFRELDHNIQTQDFTVIGIGDMAGDVFGNGMLLSRHIKLIGAFNHEHIFLDPNPDPETSYEERKRLFNLPRSTWEDYDRNLISNGGGVYSRTVKSIKLTPEVKAMLDIKKDFVVPNELIRVMLTAKVDLLWNGGIGTFVKSNTEDHSNVGDRSNDGIRVNGDQLLCKVVGEGGNLGFTQLGRIDYALSGGHIFTDFIDNSAGVDCSDHEVNIKILLNGIVAAGDMTIKQRNALLAEMTDDVALLVLKNNYQQTQSISISASRTLDLLDLHNRYIRDISRKGLIDPDLEFLPTEVELLKRKGNLQGLTAPEMAIMFAYCKSILNQAILDSDVPEDPYLSTALVRAFPRALREKYREQMTKHRLAREIIATLLSNAIVNEMGFTFMYQLNAETGAPTSAIVRAYTITRNIYKLAEIRSKIEKLDYKVSAKIQQDMMFTVSRVVRRATRWILRNRRTHLDITTMCEYFEPGIELLISKLDTVLVGSEKEKFIEVKEQYTQAGVSEDIATYVASDRAMISSLDIIDAAQVYGFDLEEVAATYFNLGEQLELGWFRAAINLHPADNEWDNLAKEASRDDLDWQQRGLTIAVLQSGLALPTLEEKISAWIEKHSALIERWKSMLNNLRSSSAINFVMFSVAVRELMDLTQASFYASSSQPGNVFLKRKKNKDARNKNSKADAQK